MRIAAPRFEFVEDRRFQIRQCGEEAIGDAVLDDIAQGLHRIEFGTVQSFELAPDRLRLFGV